MRKNAFTVLALSFTLGCATSEVTEYVNITFTPSIDTSHYTRWSFDPSQVRDTGDPRVDDTLLRKKLLEALEQELAALGYECVEEDPDFLVFYHMEILPPVAEFAERGRGRIFIEDVGTGRHLWCGERKAPLLVHKASANYDGVGVFVHELVQYTSKLKSELRER